MDSIPAVGRSTSLSADKLLSYAIYAAKKAQVLSEPDGCLQ
jgi:hypothetical protein